MTSRRERQEELSKPYSINVTGRNVHVTDAMKAYAQDKLEKLEHIASSRIIDVTVLMDIQKLHHVCEIIMKYGPTTITSSGDTNDMYASIDLAVKRLDTQLRRYLDRIHDHHAKGHAALEIAETIYEGFVKDEIDEQDVNSTIEKENIRRNGTMFSLPQIVRTEKQQLKILTNEEAIMEMDLAKASILVFRDENSRKLRVLYRRKDGNLGIVEPE